MTSTIFVGTDASKDGAGLHPLLYSKDTGWVCGRPFKGACNASFAVYSPRFDLHYLVDEDHHGTVGVYRRTKCSWQEVARVGTEGAEPCYIALDSAQSRLAVANYGSGSIAMFRLNASTGLPVGRPEVRHNAGNGPVEDRQDGSHAHCACFGPDGQWLYHVDLGADEIIAYSLAADNASLGVRQVAYTAPAGSGPRHLVFHPQRPLAVLASELASTLTILHVDGATLTLMHTISTLPVDYTKPNLVGHLSLNRAGDRIYVTNRGHNSIATFAWANGGMPILMQHIPSGGTSPRAFAFDEAWRTLVLVNEKSGNVTMFNLMTDGTFAPHHANIEVPGAVFAFIETPQFIL